MNRVVRLHKDKGRLAKIKKNIGGVLKITETTKQKMPYKHDSIHLSPQVQCVTPSS